MRKNLLLAMFIAVINLALYSQAPRLIVSSEAFSLMAPNGEYDSCIVVIQNTGSRDLTWNIKDILGDTVFFEKKNYADWTLPENQDRIHPKVAITRADKKGLFNAALENEFGDFSPEYTLWAMGRVKYSEMSDYGTWVDAVNWNPPAMVDNYISMVIPDYNRFYEFVFHSWTESNEGGGFSYTRTEIPTWIDFQKTSGVILPGKTDTLIIYADASNHPKDKYRGLVIISSNDPVNPDRTIALDFEISEGKGKITTSESAINFGNAFVTFPKKYELHILNDGTGDLTITDISATTPEFNCDFQDFTISPYIDTTIVITFTPQLKQLYSDTLYITSNDTETPVYKLPLSGTGVFRTDIDVNLSSIEETVQQGTIVQKQLIISNTDTSDLVWSIHSPAFATGKEVWFKKENYADFLLPENQDSLSPGVSLTRANQNGIYNIKNELSYNSDFSPEGTLWLYGKTEKVYNQEHLVWREAIDSDPLAMVGKTLSVIIPEDTMYYDIIFNSWTPNANGGGFSYTRKAIYKWIKESASDGINGTLVSDTVTISLDARGVTNGVYTSTIEVISNDPDEGIVSIPVQMTVTGGEPEISTDVTEIDFLNVFVGDTLNSTFTIENKGLAGLQISEITTNSTILSVSPATVNIPAFGKKEITVKLIPTSVSVLQDTLYIHSDAPDAPVLKIPVHANVIPAPGIQISQQSFSADLTGNDTVTYQIIINNTGGSGLEYFIRKEKPVIFTKENYADWTKPENQDRITDHVWITRADNRGLFNIYEESQYDDYSPAGTQWAFAPTEDALTEDYTYWADAVGWAPPDMVGETLSLYIPENEIYYDLLFGSWTENNAGGGFSYLREEALPRWMKFTSRYSYLPAGESDTIQVSIISNGLFEGEYLSEFMITTNVPGKHILPMDASLKVTGFPDISVSEAEIDFGPVNVGFPDTISVEIENTGTDSLLISGITPVEGIFRATENSFLIMPGKKDTLNVIFSPEGEAVQRDTIRFSTNAASHPAIAIPVTGSGINPSKMQLNPESLSYQVLPDTIIHDTIIITNNGEGDLVWNASIYDPNIMENLLSKLNAESQKIIDAIPNRYDIEYDGDQYSINDGGGNNDMYDVGNRLNTSLSSSIPYSDNIIANGETYFGPGTSYFTRHFPGLFVMVADVNNISSFSITGDLGADGGGSMDTTTFEFEADGTLFQGFVKRVYSASDPSVNHLIIIEKNNSATQTVSPSTNNDLHVLNGITGTKRIYYLLYAGYNGAYINDESTLNIMTTFLGSVYKNNSWIELSFTNDTVPFNSTDTIGVTINTTGFDYNNYQTEIEITSNDPSANLVLYPVQVNLNKIKTLQTLPDILVNEGFDTDTVDYSGVFENVAGGPLNYLIYSTEPQVVTADTLNGKIIITEQGTGTSIITIRTDDGNGEVQYEDFLFTVNFIPKVNSAIADITEDEGFGTYTVNLNSVFVDLDGLLTYSAVSSNTSIVSVSVNGSTLTITEAGLGTSTITVTAEDEHATFASDVFTFKVNSIPVVNTSLADVTEDEGFGTYTVNLAGKFSDSDDATLTYTAVSTNTAVVTVSVNGSTLTVTEVGTGFANITVTAEDSNGATASDVFKFTVNNVSSVEGNSLRGMELYPVPAKDKIYLSLTGESRSVRIILTDVTGKVVLQDQFNYADGKKEIDLSSVEKGIYFMQILTEEASEMREIVIE